MAFTYGQGEYGGLRAHDCVVDVLLPWLARRDCARIDADTRLAHDDCRHCRTPDQYLSLIGRLHLVVTGWLHSMVLALRAGVPVLAGHPVLGGAKVTAQSGILRWLAMVGSENLSTVLQDHWWNWCPSPAGGAAARRRSTRLSPVSGRPMKTGGASRLTAGDGGTRPVPGAEASPCPSPTPPMEET
ncbi:polysaccharide pyruvyl transferase family protein [Streptomyces sp. C3-3]|uniref:polysaccharide pyruvyl transferase family protein n=1 Tax=Streptomyces sp. C3-3 TaxID=2824901 RepID=UPI001B35F700|nr:polysaccharide pyruvyl transferase family protein [Streptomyces sp. C3-3]MBQ1116499.1 polysaccharide pyruvyl transferase family protein [Streptomyces sp. C3-3]